MLRCFAFLLGLFGSTIAFAGGTVTDCSPAQGENALADALAAGGRVVIGCPPASVIKLTNVLQINQTTEIEGNNTVFDTREGGRFVGSGNAMLILRNLTLRGSPPPVVRFRRVPARISGPIHLDLTNVVVEDATWPIAVDSVNVRAGRFAGNRGTIIRAKRAWITGGTIFGPNPGATPLSPPVDGIDLTVGEQATIDDATFFENDPIRWRGKLSVNRVTFISSGSEQSNGGAIWLDGEGEIAKCTFVQNKAKAGGAIFLENGTLAIQRGTFRGNSAEFGGAINVEYRETAPPATKLKITYSRFTDNSASWSGGAIYFGGSMHSEHVLLGGVLEFARNTAKHSGGAISMMDATIILSRAVFVENVAFDNGGAISNAGFTWAKARFGNLLMVRNKSPKGAGYYGGTIELVSSTIADNLGQGLYLTRPPFWRDPIVTFSVANSILSKNEGNCTNSGDNVNFQDLGHNIQFPLQDCDASFISADPVLDTMYVPAVFSPARQAGNNKLCVNHDLVRARDVFGDARPEGGRCTIGAVERDLERRALHALRDPEQPVSPLRYYLSILGLERYAIK